MPAVVVGTLLAVVFAGVGRRPVAEAGSSVQTTEVCFTVHNLGDREPSVVYGTFFHTDAYGPDSTATLLIHGSVAERSSWDGVQPTVTGVPSVARQLAEAGYGVFTIDRLGYGESRYRGSGWTLTPDGYVEMTHEIVQQIRSGSFSLLSGSCADGTEPARGASRVVLMGYSGGAGIIELYATRYHDIDAIVPMVWSSQGASFAFIGAYFGTLAPQYLQGKDYVYLFPAGPDGYSQACEDFAFYKPGISDEALAQLCGLEYYGNVDERISPSGEMASSGALQQQIKAGIGFVGPTSALLVFADQDAIFTGPDYGRGEPDVVTPEIEMWTTRCNCDVDVLVQPDAGHANWLHDSGPGMIDDVITWLRDREL